MRLTNDAIPCVWNVRREELVVTKAVELDFQVEEEEPLEANCIGW